MLRGEVWQARLPGGGGHAQAGTRPVLILQHDHMTAALPTVIVVPFTGQQGAARFPGTLLVQPDTTNGLKMPSVLLVFQVRALDKTDLSHRLGEVDGTTLTQVLALLGSLVG